MPHLAGLGRRTSVFVILGHGRMGGDTVHKGPRPSLWEVPAGKENVESGGPRVPMFF